MMERAAIESLNRHCTDDQIKELRWQHRNSQVSAVGDLEGWAQHDVLAKLKGVGCPMLVIRGEDDFWLPRELAEETAKAIKGAEIRHLRNIGHYPMFEDPKLICKIITDFCRRHGVLS